MQFTIREDILIADDFWDLELNQKCIEYFETAHSSGLTATSEQVAGNINADRKDEQLFLHDSEEVLFTVREIIPIFMESFWEANKAYWREYPILAHYPKYSISHLKLQKTKPQGGFHNFHAENMGRQYTSRLLTWMLYLNTVQEGGETEFLYKSLRVEPKAGRFVLWPSGYTHTHRGNPPLNQDKYILTGWAEQSELI